jgi:hypothetical protein
MSGMGDFVAEVGELKSLAIMSVFPSPTLFALADEVIE